MDARTFETARSGRHETICGVGAISASAWLAGETGSGIVTHRGSAGERRVGENP